MTPNESHFEICSLAMDTGFHIICDKPLTTDLDSAVRLARKVQYVQGYLASEDVPFGWRLDPMRIVGSMILIDIGTHAHHLAGYVTGLDLEKPAQTRGDSGLLYG